jgi:hypothetical protein
MGAHAALLLLTGLAGCAAADLPAVTATGAAGERLRYDDPVLSAAPALCLEVASLSGANDDCAALRPEARAWSRVATLLEAYAAALARAARHHARGEGLLSPGVAGGSWTGLKPEDAAAATALANATRVLETDSDVIKRAITDADAPIQVLAKDLDAILERRVANIDLAETSIDVVRQRLQEVAAAPAPPVSRPPAHPAAPSKPEKGGKADCADIIVPTVEAIGVRLAALHETLNRQSAANQVGVPGSLAGLAAVQNDLESKRSALVRFREGLSLFARAHKTLHDNVDQLDSGSLVAKLTSVAEPAPPESSRTSGGRN